MNIMDHATHHYIELSRIERELEGINGDESQFELVQLVLRAADELRGVMKALDIDFDLRMNEE